MSRALPKVSVITITYGHEKYIMETLDGVLMQQYDGPVELIIANDNSPDATDEVVKKYFLENPAPENFEIRYTKHDSNKGMMPNFIWALEQATGKYIALCEGDDYWTDPLKLQKQVGFLEENKQFGMVHTNYSISIGGHIQVKKSNTRLDEYDYYLKTGDIRTLTVCFRAEFINSFINLSKKDFMSGAVAGDRPLFLLIAQSAGLHFMNDSCGVYREDSSGSTSNFKDIEKDLLFRKNISELNLNLFKHFNITKYQNRYRMGVLYYATIIKHRCNILKVFGIFLKNNIRVNYYKSYITILIKLKRKKNSFCD